MNDAIDAFLARWQGVDASELAAAQSFVIDLCRLLDLPVPHPTPEQDYMFERPVVFVHGDGSTSQGRIDCYRRGCFVLEAKKLKAGAGKSAFDDRMLAARAQAEGYARALPASEGRPPFLIVVDVGNVIELYAEFTRSGGTYTPFPDPRAHRIRLEELRREEVRARLRAVWLDPLSLDPTRQSARVTRAVAAHLAEAARALEAEGHAPETVAGFLTRCLFCMFAEDIGLLPKGAFTGLLESALEAPAQFAPLAEALWREMDAGGFSVVLRQPIARFNGKLFKTPQALPLARPQIERLIEAARADWTQVEPAIFGTLLERALDPDERHALGAHYTPRAYVERLVLPALIEPLREEWRNAQAAAVLLAREGRHKEAVAEIRAFHHRLCSVRVLDPACGSGNFLYVALEHMKRLEGEALNQLHDLGETQTLIEAEGLAVDPHQFLGLELNPRAAAIAELVLWIGYLQWHFRTRGQGLPPSPILRDFRNIECRDAVLAHDGAEPVTDERGEPVTRWDGRTMKPHPATGEPVPDETARVPLMRYRHPRPAAWPQADVVIGNPPFIGNKRMRATLGDGYVEALRAAWRAVPDSADYVMFWWHKAAQLAAQGKIARFGFITTNSITMTFNRRVVQAALEAGLQLEFAIPDHPWVDSSDGAAVRIAMTVAAKGSGAGRRLEVIAEREGEGEGEGMAVELAERRGLIHADLSIGANVAAAQTLRANGKLSNRGVIPHGAGFIVTPEERARLEADAPIKPYRNGRDLTDRPRGVLVIDCYGFEADEVRRRWPAVYQWLWERVKPERDQNRRPKRRDRWWRFAEDQPRMRESIASLPRYIVTPQVAKHRVFQFLDASILPDDKLIVIALDDAFALGVLSSRVHIIWALAAGGTLEDRPVYNKTRCFDTFPFPDEDTGLTPALAARIGDLAEQIDAHRKRVLAGHEALTLTGLYNVLEKLKRGEALSARERAIHDQGLVAVLKSLHEELDEAVLEAYGWTDNPSGEHILERLVALNARRAQEEAQGRIRWLRPDFQAGGESQAAIAGLAQGEPATGDHGMATRAEHLPWPATLPGQMAALASVLTSTPQTEAQLAARFTGLGRGKARLPELLATLATLGRARQLADGRWTR